MVAAKATNQRKKMSTENISAEKLARECLIMLSIDNPNTRVNEDELITGLKRSSKSVINFIFDGLIAKFKRKNEEESVNSKKTPKKKGGKGDDSETESHTEGQ